jgi:type VI secretion system protein ImpL
MKKLLGKIFSPWVLVAIGLAAFAAIVWFVGPLVSIGRWYPLESELVRWITIGVVVGAYLLSKAWAALKAMRTNRAITQQLVAKPADKKDDETPEEKVLRERFDQALQTLRKARFEHDTRGLATLTARFGKRHLYELPWYVIIGAPGSGKTTALLNAGLRFPLAPSGQKPRDGLAGVGGTRNCDWWFTDQAVLIDTAGRYTSQDSDAQNDQKAWQRFLSLLKQARPRQPINGALLTVSVPDLLTKSAAERERLVTDLRSRVQELHEHFGHRFPVYLLVTKIDLISGFVDYLGDADKEMRAAPWGFTFDHNLPQAQRPAAMKRELELLVKRMADGLVERLQTEHDPARRARIYAFPQQFAAIHGLLANFVEGVFAPSQYEEAVMLRGMYFVSGTQEGTPLDRVIGQVARAFQLDRLPVPAHHHASAKSYFLEKLLQDVVFAESALGGTNLKWERRRGVLALAGYAAVALLGVGLTALWLRSYVANQDYVAGVATKTEKAQQLLTALPQTRADDLTAPLAALEAARTVAKPEGAPPSINLGLGQQRMLESAADQTYRRLLGETWLPRLVSRLETQLAISSTNPNLRYEMLKAYRMLHEPQHFDAKGFDAFIRADWEQMGNALNDAQRDAMRTHLATLLDDGVITATTPENAAVVANARASLVSVPLAQRIFTRIELLGVGDFPEFTLAKVGGPQTPLVFTRTSGKPLTSGVAGMYTYDGYHKGFVNVAEGIAKQLAAEEPWVLGVTDSTRSPTVAAAAAAAKLTGRDPVFEEVRRLYLVKYANTWDAYIRDIRVVPVRGLRDAIQASQILGAPGGPLVPVMRALSKETTLAAKPTGVVDKAKAEAGSIVKEGVSKIFDLAGDKPAAAAARAASPEAELVDSRFVAMRDFVTAPGGQGPAPVDASVTLINEVYNHLNVVDAALQAKNAPPPSPVAAKVKNEAARLPEPVKTMVVALNDAAQQTSAKGLRDNLSDIIATEVGDFCRKATAGRYPFDRNAKLDVTSDDFTKLFAAGGLFDATFQKHLAANVNTTTRPWSFRKIDGASLGAPGSLIQFQRAAEIRDAFFATGKLGMRLVLEPVELDAALKSITLDVDGQHVKYAHGPIVPTVVNWPGTKGTNQVRVTVDPPAASGTSGTFTEGPWALLRMFDRQQITLSPTASEKATVKFVVEGRGATFDVTSSSVQNPLRLKALQDFGCPGGL